MRGRLKVSTTSAADQASTAVTAVRRKIAEWQESRAEFRAIEEAEHPARYDRYGREWTWVSGDLWHHDDTLAYPLDMIDGLSLPPERLRDNPNYHRLCGICRSQWTDNSPVSPRCRCNGQWFDVRDRKFYDTEKDS